jgi:hypothetical protein
MNKSTALSGLVLLTALVQPALAYQFAVWLDGQADSGGNGIPSSLANAFGSGSVTYVTTPQLETPGFLSAFDAVVISRHGAAFGTPLSALAASNIAAYVGNGAEQGGVAIFANDAADNLFGATGTLDPFDPNLDQLFVNAATSAAASHHGLIAEFNGAVMAVASNAAGWPAIGVLPGSASATYHASTPNGQFIWDVGPIGTTNPIDTGVTFPFTDSDTTLYRTDITGASSNNIVDVFDDNGLPSLMGNGGVICDDQNPCTMDTFVPVQGCQHSPVADGTACSDGNVCNRAATCQAGTCTPGTALSCDDNNPCTADTCDAVKGCQHTAVPNGTACNDGNACTRTDTCQAGTCTPGTPLSCDDNNPCTTDTCDAVKGCQHTAVPNGTACNDGNACTQTDTCQADACVGGSPVVCAAADQCHVAGSCDPATGVCSQPVKPDGSACDDGDVCTAGDTCQAGGCQPGPRVACIPAPAAPVVVPGPAPTVTLNVERPPTTSATSAVITVAGYVTNPASLMANALGADRAADSAGLLLAVRRHGNPCSATAPAGTVQVTNCVIKSVKRRKSQVPVKLKLNKLGRKLLSEQGGFTLQVAGSIAEHHGGSSPLVALLKLLR